MKMRYYIAAGMLVVAAAIAFAWFLPELPEQVAIHWNLHGSVDRYATPWALFLAGPVAMLAVMAVFALLPVLSPRRFEVDGFLRAYLDYMLIAVALLGYLFGVLLWAALHGPGGLQNAFVAGACVMAILVGNLLGKVRRNFFIGIRTPWTLASERVWYATHRMGARVIVAAGTLALVSVFAGWAPWIGAIVVAAGFVVPAVYSLVLYKRLEREGGLDGPAQPG